jgi:hypothetical protein
MTLVCVLFVPWDVWGKVSVGMVNPFWVPENADWSRIATIVGFAGIGGMGNILASNYVREKGWGMGSKVGAIASAFGGHQISLSHIGTMCHPTEEGKQRFDAWWAQIKKDQFGLWMWGSIIGMLLPCLLGAQYLQGDYFHGTAQWKAAVALAQDFGGAKGEIFTKLTLLCGFIIMFPGTFSSMDGIARRWCDAIWSGSRRARSAEASKAKYLYYSFIAAYVAFGLIAFIIFGISAPKMMKLSGTMANFTIMVCILHTLWVNTHYLPKAFQPSMGKRIALVLSALFYAVIFTMMVVSIGPSIVNGTFFK